MEKPWIFISYRRTDSSCWAGRIYDRLAALYGPDSVYRDTHSIPAGQEFPPHIHQAINKSQIVLVVIGPQWSGVEEGGQRRIDNKEDVVRQEIEAALVEKKKILPILVDTTTMPADLPLSIKALAGYNSIAVRDKDFAHDMKVLIDQIDQELKQPPSFNMALWKPFQEGRTVIVFPRIALRDSSYINSEEIRLLVGPLRFLNANVAQSIKAIADMGQTYREDNHLVILGSPALEVAPFVWTRNRGP